jgi:hypothetical protein
MAMLARAVIVCRDRTFAPLSEREYIIWMPGFVNYYRCSNDGTEWADVWSCMCNDKCPSCNAEIEPYRSNDIDSPLAHELAMQD